MEFCFHSINLPGECTYSEWTSFPVGNNNHLDYKLHNLFSPAAGGWKVEVEYVETFIAVS